MNEDFLFACPYIPFLGPHLPMESQTGKPLDDRSAKEESILDTQTSLLSAHTFVVVHEYFMTFDDDFHDLQPACKDNDSPPLYSIAVVIIYARE